MPLPTFHPAASLLAAATVALLGSALPSAAWADLAPKLDGTCPSHYTLGKNSNGKPTCFSPRDIENQNKAAQAKADKNSGKSSSSSSGKSGGYAYIPPTKGSVAKSGPLQACPSGYYGNSQGDLCITHWEDAPAVTAKKGACPAGTVEEWGAWCTAALKDTTDPTLDQVSGYATRDFNAVYLAHQMAGKPTPSFEVKPGLMQQAVAQRQAAGQPWKPKHERDRDAEKAQQTAQAAAPAEAGADSSDPTTKDLKEAGKALGSAIKGLFTR